MDHRRISARISAIVFLTILLSPGATNADKADWPEGPGLAAQYPGDRGIAEDPNIILVENFDHGAMRQLRDRWSDIKNPEGISFSDDIPPGSAGRRSLRMDAKRGQDTGAHLFTRILPGYDEVYARFYVKFAADHGFLHHFVGLGGAIDPPAWPTGGAGLRPENAFNTGIEPTRGSYQRYPPTFFDPPGIWHFYTYWQHMRSWQNEDGTGNSFFGNNFEPREPVLVPRDQWVCVEMMIRMNSELEASDGAQAFWIDGKLVGPFGPDDAMGYFLRENFIYSDDPERASPLPGFQWRSDPRLNINKFFLSYYMSERAFEQSDRYASDNPDAVINTQTGSVWFDHIVLARQYIGPIQPAPAGGGDEQ